jgi:nucleotidyltransferase substrate binding protein (TIGR01987 family)
MLGRLDLSSLRDAIASLGASLTVTSDQHWFGAQAIEVRNTLIAGVIQNFEFVYELGIKMIRRQLEAEAASPTEIDAAGYRDLLRLAAEKGLIADVEARFGYRQMRNLSSHTYDQRRAQEIYERTSGFLDDARALLAALEARNGRG